MKKRFITNVKQIGPEKEKNTFWLDVMRSKLGTTGYGRKKV